MATPVPCLNPSPRISLTLVSATPGAPVGLEADIVPSASPQNGVTLNSDGLYVQGTPPVVSALPGSPFDGMEVYYHDPTQDSAIKWHLRYSASSSNTYKWEFLGGPWLMAETTGADTLAGQNDTNYHAVSNGPSVICPLNGVYTTYITARVDPANDAGAGGIKYGIGLQYSGTITPAGEADAAAWNTPTGPTLPGIQQVSKMIFNRSMTGGQAVKLNYANSAASGEICTYTERIVAILPVRVG